MLKNVVARRGRGWGATLGTHTWLRCRRRMSLLLLLLLLLVKLKEGRASLGVLSGRRRSRGQRWEVMSRSRRRRELATRTKKKKKTTTVGR